MIKACVTARDPQSAISFLKEMKEKGLKPSQATFGKMIRAYARSKDSSSHQLEAVLRHFVEVEGFRPEGVIMKDIQRKLYTGGQTTKSADKWRGILRKYNHGIMHVSSQASPDLRKKTTPRPKTKSR
eukprot:TRINITY_DN19862_c0_g1_i1.p1 TRINITY_DN19862_c0_g1~~TRINITY_DN19862_c0_g1_i1.p1  ORF type:complete len:127 (-),score=9.80 TRINITY_DN19862_c0_g1_i1:92-472(-)